MSLKSGKISTARIASVLKGIDFPKSKRGIIMQARKQKDSHKEDIISVLHGITNKKYQNLVQVEKEIGRVK